MEALRTLRAVPGVIAPVRLSLILLACGGTCYIYLSCSQPEFLAYLAKNGVLAQVVWQLTTAGLALVYRGVQATAGRTLLGSGNCLRNSLHL